MYLKEIRIKGFKSFADKIKLTITSGITVIVGPNGCGKSNITDAVRWILGEQNIRSLRGNNLTDMIFSGNNLQKMRNVAEVSILFDNIDRKLSIDSEQVELKRIIYRSGETENYINGISCKLKDIHELFWGTGLGKNSYSIIAQGKVDFVLNAKPSERRILFEEASNISSYNNKKNIAIKKLDLVKNNLVRVSDILSEVKENLLHYKRKAEDLKAYRSYRDYIERLEYFLLSQRFELYKNNTEKYQQILVDLNNEVIKLTEILKYTKEEISELEKKKKAIEEQLINSEEVLEKTEKEKTHTSNRLILLRQKKEETDNYIKNLHIDLENSRKQFKKFKETIFDIEKNLKKTELNCNLIKEKDNKDRLLLNRYNNIVSQYKQKIINIEEAHKKFVNIYFNRYREDRVKEETIIKSLESSLVIIEKEKNIIVTRLENNKKLIQNIERNISYYKKEIMRFEEEKNIIDKEIIDKRISIDKEYTIIRCFDNDIILKNKEKDFLEELEKNNLHGNIVIEKKILEEKDFQGVCLYKEIREIIKDIPDSLGILISFILKNKLQLFKVNNYKQIIDLDRYLKENNLGKINIISDDIRANNVYIKEKEKIKTFQSQLKILGFANEILQYPSEYSNLFETLLGHVIVVEDMTNAFNLYTKLKGQWIIVSLDGLMIDYDGVIIVNISSTEIRTNNIILPKDKIKKLKEEIKIIHNNKSEHQDILNIYKKDNNQLNQKLNGIVEELKKYEIKLNKENNNLVEIEKKNTSLENQLKSLKYKKIDEEERQKMLSNKMMLSKTSIERIEEHMISFQQYFDCIDKIKSFCLKNIDFLRNDLENNKLKLTWNEERIILLKKQKEEMDEFIQNYQLEENERLDKIEDYNKEKQYLLKQESELDSKLQEIIQKLGVLNENRLKYRDYNKKYDNLLRNSREKIEKNQYLLEDKRNIYHKSEMTKVQNEEKINHLLETIKNQYNSTIDEILLHKNEVNSQKEAVAKITEYKEKITQMGQINFDALQECQVQAERFNELQAKREEIVKSKEKLISIIDEIDRIAEDNFYQTFLRVEKNFKDIFQKLFSGGQVSLKLTNEKKILDTGIEVMAQPPGKKLQNISLLSTGERALTAIALLFALWKANPSPFCFFDEIDSSLDEANALRLASFLKNEDFKDAQIILITHQRGVMESADALYGITMEKSGISKLMSVKIVDTGEQKN